MDGRGVDRALLIPYPVVDDVRAAHDEIAGAVRRHPDRFTGAALIPPFSPPAFFHDEARRCAEELGMRALKLQPQYHALNPLSPRSDFFFETALERGWPVVCHTGAGAPFALPSLFIAAARRFPELLFVLGHSGGSIYYAEAIVAAEVCPNVVLELSTVAAHQAVEIAERVSADRLMIGSDLPASLPVELTKILELPIDEALKETILWRTPRRVFDGA